jgi:DNA (cytosine-5)-methyltransferase 1
MMRELALFAGAGGGILGGKLLGWCTVCAVEIDSFCRSVLLARQKDGVLPEFPIWDDVQTFNGKPWRGHIDVITGGFPCQDISAAGKGAGIAGSRSGLVFEMLRIIDEVRPPFVFAENSPQLRTKGLATIVERFISMGYVGRVGVLGAGHIGANHERKRMWIVAKNNAPNTNSAIIREQQRRRCRTDRESPPQFRISDWWNLPRFTRVDDGMANRMDRIKATGNGQVPGVAALAWTVLTADIEMIQHV